MTQSEFTNLLKVGSRLVEQIDSPVADEGECIETNTILIRESLVAYLFLISDFPTSSSSLSVICKFKNFLGVLKSFSFSDIVSSQSRCVDFLRRNPYSDWATFKKWYNDTVSMPLNGLSPVRKEIEEWYLTYDVKYWSAAIQGLCFLKKIPIDAAHLHDATLLDYRTFEDTLDLQYPSDLIFEINGVLKGWLSELQCNNAIPHHGPGSTSDAGRDVVRKQQHLGLDLKLSTTLRLYKWPQWLLDLRFPRSAQDRCSELVFVPKTVNKLRSISMEPTSLQFFQQGFKDELYHYITHHPVLRHKIPLLDQTKNQRMAQQASIADNFATIDLSNASDSITLHLVKLCFAGTSIYPALLGTRSSQTRLPDGSILTLRKFAPMGSALCFPVESLLFAACCEVGYRRSSSRNSQFRVYGDDMICPSEVTPMVLGILASLHFQVNSEKTFIQGPFRESCGGDYFLGKNVTPVYYRILSDISSNHNLRYFQMCDLSNYCWEKGLLNLRRYIINRLLLSYSPLFGESVNHSPMVYSYVATNFHLKKRFNKSLFRCEYYATSVTTRSTRLPDDVRYFLTLLDMSRRNSLIDECVLPGSTRKKQTLGIMKSKWVFNYMS